MKTPKVSILVPVYNVSAFIERCAHSLFRQTFDDLEFVFVNDCTPDDSMTLLQAVIDQYPERKSQIVIVNHPVNKGIGATRNTLLETATGDYLMWVDSDDFIAIDAVEKIVCSTDGNDTDIIILNSYFLNKGASDIRLVSHNSVNTPLEYLTNLSMRKAKPALWSYLSKRSLWLQHQIEPISGVNYGEDYYITFRLFYYARTILSYPNAVYYYNLTNVGSYSTGVKTEMHFSSIIRIFQQLDSFLLRNDASQTYTRLLEKGKLLEIGALLLHTSASLRRRYGTSITLTQLNCYKSELPFSKWQFFILKLILSHRFIAADLTIFVAKILRQAFKIPF